MPLASVRVLRRFMANLVCLSPGDEVEIPEVIAARAVASGAAEWNGFDAITARCLKFFEALIKKSPWNPEY
jgi:hypothetical protein